MNPNDRSSFAANIEIASASLETQTALFPTSDESQSKNTIGMGAIVENATSGGRPAQSTIHPSGRQNSINFLTDSLVSPCENLLAEASAKQTVCTLQFIFRA
jgi:hypothetical protein